MTIYRVCPRIVLLLAWSLGAPSISHAQLYNIAQPKFSSLILKDGSYTAVNPVDPGDDSTISRAILKTGQLFFSFTILGGEETLRYLTNKKRLEVKCIIWRGDDGEPIEVGIRSDRWEEDKAKIVEFYNANGYFTWRTFVTTERIEQGPIEVIIKDVRGTIIKTVGYPGSYAARIKIGP